MRPANLCRPCGLDFVTTPTFDAHRVGDHEYTLAEGLTREPPVYDGRRCLSVDELEAAGWRQNRYGRWSRGVKEQVLERVEL